MTYTVDETHDPQRRSWLDSAGAPGCDFPVQNLPFCVFKADGREAGVGVGIGDQVIDLRVVLAHGLLAGDAADAARAASSSSLNALMALGPRYTLALRHGLFQLLRSDGADTRLRELAGTALLPIASVQLLMPAQVGDYTDFLTSRHHTERLGRFKGLKVPLPPAFMSLPVAYHGRASSLRVSGTNVTRPHGQFIGPDGKAMFGPSRHLDFELEMAAFVRGGTELGRPVSLRQASDHLFGLALFNDWSAKDIQWWEQVLGPFLGKSFLTSVSPWIVTMEALAPFRVAAAPREAGDPPLLAYLADADDQKAGAFQVDMEVWLRSAAMRASGLPAERLASARLSELYWTFAQMLTHHTSNGCNLMPGDMLGSGTVSGREDGSAACITEITEAGSKPIKLPGGEERKWLHDGDEVVFRARAQRDGFVGIGFGECAGTVVPAYK